MSELKFYEYSDTKNPKYLVIFLHGYGSNGQDLLNLAYEFKGTLPEAHFISPNAIEPWEGGFPGSYQWFSLNNDFMQRKALEEIGENIKNSNEKLQKFIQTQLSRFNLTTKNLFLIGFSQGAMMSMYQGFIASEKPAGIVAFSGKLILPEMIGQKLITKPEICLIHGKDDSVVPFSNFLDAKKGLETNNVDFESHELSNLDHSIDIRGVRAAQNFIKRLAK